MTTHITTHIPTTAPNQPAFGGSRDKALPLEATAQARANIALIKYWGKRDSPLQPGRRAHLNLPATGSLSVTLDGFRSTTRVSFTPGCAGDSLVLNGAPAGARQLQRVSDCLAPLRARACLHWGARVETENNFPTAAGLASSAAGFAALVSAAARALGLGLSAAELSMYARCGSGSAARSIFGGFVEMCAGRRSDGTDAVARPILAAADWPLEIVIAIVSLGRKAVSSSAAMAHCAATSPYHGNWISTTRKDLVFARHAVLAKDFEALATISEHSCLKMHAAALAAQPGLLYWRGATVDCMHYLRELRQQGVPVFFTIDAGPQVKAFCLPGHSRRVADALADIPGVIEVRACGIGGGARVLGDDG